VKRDRLTYMTEMTAACAAIAAFVTVYVVGFMQAGLLLTLLFAWIPAAALAWFTARALQATARTFLDVSQTAADFPGFGGDDDALEPIVLRDSRRSYRAGRAHWLDDERY